MLKILSTLLIVPFLLNNNVKQNASINDAIAHTLNAVDQVNLDTYVTKDGKTHNVVWLPGVDAPKMSGDENLIGTPGYFYLNNYTDPNGLDYQFYEAPMETNKGYYDLNKDMVERPKEGPLCYLAAAGNMLLYWLHQNETFVNQYTENLKNGVYGQENTLHKVFPYSQTRWDDLLKEPNLHQIRKLKGQLLSETPIIMDALRPYYERSTDGYWPDRVIDFFLNGYTRWDKGEGDLQNKEEDFKLDSFGGYFNPLFGNKIMSTRDSISRYEIASNLVGKYIIEGRALSISYLNDANVAGAHAITLWGAEYDENNQLVRVFVTDSDDFENNVTGSNSDHVTGLHAWNIFPDENGAAIISTNVDPSQGGANLQSIYSIVPSKEEMSNRLNDLSKPTAPELVTYTKEINNALNSYHPQNISVDYQNLDNGYLTYQWYESSDKGNNFSKVKNAMYPTLVPSVNVLGQKLYYCEITNNKNGYKVIVNSPNIVVNTIDEPLVDAATPTFTFNGGYALKYNQYETARALHTYGKVSDEGTLTFQWYYRNYGDNSATGGVAIPGATNEYIIPFTDKPGRYFYYCVLTNTNPYVNGRQVVSVNTRISQTVIINEANQDLQNAVNFANDFISANICGTDDFTKADANKFKSFEPKFSKLSVESQNYLKQAKGDENSSNPIEVAIAKYDRIISLYHNDKVNYPDFIERLGTPNFTFTGSNLPTNEFDANYLIIGVLSVGFAIALVCLFVMLKNKKRHN